MNLINKKNCIPIICITYTVVSIASTVYEIMDKGVINPTQLNIFLFLIFSMLGVGVLSFHRFLDRFSPVGMLILQYLMALLMINGSLWLASHIVEIHPDGYHDMTLSFSVPYLIGSVLYFLCLKIELKKQNRLLKEIRQKHLLDA